MVGPNSLLSYDKKYVLNNDDVLLVLIINGVEETIPLLNNVSLTDNCNILFLLIELLSVFGPNSLLSYDKKYVLNNDDVLPALIINGVEETIPLLNNVSLTDNCIISFLLIELFEVGFFIKKCITRIIIKSKITYNYY